MTASMVEFLPDKSKNAELRTAIERLGRTEDVVRIALMPDAHVAEDVCVGTVTATTRRILPAAVGGDIGCGMVAVRLRSDADLLADRDRAALVLAGLYEHIPHAMHASKNAPELPDMLRDKPLAGGALDALKRREGRLEFATLGRGNHFLEVQSDDENHLWLLVHSGSRCMGPAIRQHYESRAEQDPSGLAWLDVDSEIGRAYLEDAAWAAHYARASRATMVNAAMRVFGDHFGVEADTDTRIEVDHNHVRSESHDGHALWVHRKGAMGLAEGEPGVVPGSMGSESFHVEGRGCAEALCSSAHGAGREMSRSEARKRIAKRQLLREAHGVWFDHRLADRLCEEAPSAYKDIGAVMRAQQKLVRIIRRLRPVLVYKAA
jgi:tRNA-splicing ligase RtcB (3'-phosphate/5'-hydroxy nucleic acid ligase)